MEACGFGAEGLHELCRALKARGPRRALGLLLAAGSHPAVIALFFSFLLLWPHHVVAQDVFEYTSRLLMMLTFRLRPFRPCVFPTA